jgi:hypothetical protein
MQAVYATDLMIPASTSNAAIMASNPPVASSTAGLIPGGNPVIRKASACGVRVICQLLCGRSSQAESRTGYF